MVKKFVKKKISILLAATLILSGFSTVGVCGIEAEAVDDTKKFHAEQLDITEYKDKNPLPQDSQYADWVFAGWYKDVTCETYVTDKQEETGSQYAKFVPKEVLSVLCQTQVNTNENTDITKMRIISTVDTLKYREVGFRITVGDSTITRPIKTVYKSIKAVNGGVAFSYQPSALSEASTYFATLTVTNISNESFATGILIEPYWETVDGSTVYGVSRYARVEDGYLKIINVPVRLYDRTDVAAGYAEVAYDTSKFIYYGSDNGTVFDNLDTYAENGVVKCVGDINDISKNVEAYGLYANLRFKLKPSEENLLKDLTAESFTKDPGVDVTLSEGILTIDFNDCIATEGKSDFVTWFAPTLTKDTKYALSFEYEVTDGADGVSIINIAKEWGMGSSIGFANNSLSGKGTYKTVFTADGNSFLPAFQCHVPRGTGKLIISNLKLVEDTDANAIFEVRNTEFCNVNEEIISTSISDVTNRVIQ